MTTIDFDLTQLGLDWAGTWLLVPIVPSRGCHWRSIWHSLALLPLQMHPSPFPLVSTCPHCVCVCGSRSRSKQNIDRRSLAIAIAFMRAFARLPFLLLLLLLRAGKDTTLSEQSTTINCLVLFSDGVSLLLVLKANNNRSSRMCVCFYCWKSNSSIVIVFLPHFKVVLIRALPSFPPSLPTTYVHPQQYRIYDRVDICWPELSSFSSPSPSSPSSPFSSFSTLLYTQAKAKEGRNTTHGPIIDRPRSLPSRSFPRLFFVCVRVCAFIFCNKAKELSKKAAHQ